jgi:hypothetical protein
MSKSQRNLLKFGVVYGTTIFFLSLGPFEHSILPLESSVVETPVSSLIDTLCFECFCGRFPKLLDYPVLFQLFLAASLTAFFSFLPGRCNNLIQYVMLVLLNAPLLGPIISSPSLACHIIFTVSTFTFLDQVIAHERYSEKWVTFVGFAIFCTVVNLLLFPESAVMLIPLCIALFGLWNDQLVWGIVAGACGILFTGLVSRLVSWMPRWRLFVWDWARIADDCRLVRSGWVLPVVMLAAFPLRGSSVLKLSHRRMITLLRTSIGVMAVFPWSAGEQGALPRVVAIQFMVVLMAGIVLVRHRSLSVVHPLLLGGIIASWIARYRYRPLQFDFVAE